VTNVRVLTLNVAHGRGTGFHQALTTTRQVCRNLDAVVELILGTQADVVALQELDAISSWSGGFDHLDYLAARTGLDHSHHGLHVSRNRLPRVNYGTGILSRYPLERTFRFALDMNPLDTQGFSYAHVHAPGLDLSVVSVHLDFKRRKERRAQLGIMSRLLEGTLAHPDRDLLVAGDFNCRIEGHELGRFADRHTLRGLLDRSPTFPSRRPRRRLDEVLVGDAIETCGGEVLGDAKVSDHLPVLTEVTRKRPQLIL
jgi:endonuclease/exonuclease/phosphatase family metal-dependent hydrolase